jgi:hypothetical protein
MFKHGVNDKRWSKLKCLLNWISYCAKKGKNAYEIWPELVDEVYYYTKHKEEK